MRLVRFRRQFRSDDVFVNPDHVAALMVIDRNTGHEPGTRICLSTGEDLAVGHLVSEVLDRLTGEDANKAMIEAIERDLE